MQLKEWVDKDKDEKVIGRPKGSTNEKNNVPPWPHDRPNLGYLFTHNTLGVSNKDPKLFCALSAACDIGPESDQFDVLLRVIAQHPCVTNMWKRHIDEWRKGLRTHDSLSFPSGASSACTSRTLGVSTSTRKPSIYKI